MADKIKKTDIYIQKEEGNLMVIDPNKVYGDDQKPVERYVPQEELVYFVNLEANPVPRSYLDVGEDANSNRTVVAYGKMNYLGPNGGKPMDTTWTEDFAGTTNTKTAVSDSEREYFTGYKEHDYIISNEHDTQLLGIKDIQIQTKPDSLKTSIITIRMVDVRGRALFEKGPSSIYSTFFHLPYPQFYLTVKGYYGEAITYQMVLSGQVKVSFENDGDYYVTATFMATNQKLLNDIRLQDAVVSPYLYQYGRSTTTVDGEVKTVMTTRGYDILRQVYKNYYEEGLVDKKLVEKPLTMPQLMQLVDRLGTFLENELFDEADISFFSDIALYGKKLQQFNSAINEWFRKFTNTQNAIPVPQENINYVEFKKEFTGGIKETEGKKFDIIKGKQNDSLFHIFDNFITELSEIKYFGDGKEISINGKKGGGNKKKIEYSPPSLGQLTKSDFYYNESKYQMTADVFLKKLEKVFTDYTSSYESIKNQVEKVLSDVQFTELGFKPNLKNIMGVILANTETFLRVMEYVHGQAYKQRSNNDRLGAIDNKDNPDSVNDVVYPFPTVYGRNKDNKVEEFYPGDPAIKNQIRSYNVNTWPEVKLVEEYLTHTMTIGDTVAAELVTSLDESPDSKREIIEMANVFANDIPNNGELFKESSFIEIVYRIYNRAIYSVFGTGYSKETIASLGIADANNAKHTINKLLSGKNSFREGPSSFRGLYGTGFLPNDVQLIEDAKQNLLTKSIESFTEEKNGVTILSIEDVQSKEFKDAKDILTKESKTYKETGLEPYPYTNNGWVTDNLAVKSNIFNRRLSSEYDSTLRYTVTSADKDFTKENFFKGNRINPLQTPGFVTSTSDIARAFWLLNTTPTKDLIGGYSKDSVVENYFARFLGGDVKQIKRAQLLKWGSIWYRYTNNIDNGVDILDSIWTNLNITQYTGGTYGGNTFNFNPNSPSFDIGFYPELVVAKLNEYTEEEYSISDLNTLISDGKLVLKNMGDIMVPDTTQVITSWRSHFNYEKDGKNYVIKLPSYMGSLLPIDSSMIPEVINNSVDEDWSDITGIGDTLDLNFGTVLKPSPNQYVFNEEGELVTGKSIEDLVSLFSYETLETFKEEFIKFSKKITESVEDSYQHLYQPLVMMEGVDPFDITGDVRTWVEDHIVSEYRDSGLSEDMYFVLDKPMNVSFATISSYANSTLVDNPVSFGEFSTLDTSLFRRVLGQVQDSTVQTFRESFFQSSNIAATEENMKKFKGIVDVWAQWGVDNNGSNNVDDFKSFLNDIVNQSIDKMDAYIGEMFGQFTKLINQEDTNIALENAISDLSGGVELQKITYRVLKNVNDTWIGGFNWEKTNLAKLFKYINYLNEPIGDDYLVDLRVLTEYYNEQNMGKSVGSFISQFLKDNSLSEPISFASNVNFYGNLTSDDKNIDEAKKVANTIFGTHTSVNRNGLPGFVVFFRSNASEYLKIKRPNYGYKDDSMDLTSSQPNPLSSKQVDTIQVREGGRGIAFNVDFGIQHQNMFSDFSIQSYDGIKSGEELIVTEEIANMKKGSTMATISTNLLDIMKTRVYSCSIKMLGNAMIQPFMYFNLRYIPIYSGTYMILSVEHSMSPDSGMITSFTGVRVSKAGISNIDKGMVKARRNLLDNLIDKLKTKARIKEAEMNRPYGGDTENQGGFDTNNNKRHRDGECRPSSKWSNIPFNDDAISQWTKLSKSDLKNIITTAANDLALNSTGKTNIARFAYSVARREQGKSYGVGFFYDNPFGLHVDGNGSSVFKGAVKGYFCPHVSDGYVRPTAVFHDPSKGETVNDGIVNAFRSFMIDMIRRGNSYYSSENFWNSANAQKPEYLASLWAFYWNTSYRAVKGGDGKGKLISQYDNNGKSVKYTKGPTKDYSGEKSKFNSFMGEFNKL